MKKNNVKIVEKDGFDVLGYELRTTTRDKKNLVEIPEFWSELFESGKLEEIPNIANSDVYFGICTDCGADGAFSYIVGQEVDLVSEVPKGLRNVALQDSQYAVVVTDNKTPDVVNRTFEFIFDEWLPESKFERDFGEDFELYTKKNGSLEKKVEIHIPVKHKK